MHKEKAKEKETHNRKEHKVKNASWSDKVERGSSGKKERRKGRGRRSGKRLMPLKSSRMPRKRGRTTRKIGMSLHGRSVWRRRSRRERRARREFDEEFAGLESE